MKKITILCIALLSITYGFSQKVAIIGTNHVTPDGFSFVVTEAFANGNSVFFTEEEYNNSTNVFDASGEGTVKFTASTAISVGTVVFVKETSGNVFSVTCTGGGSCGNVTFLGAAGFDFFALRTDGEAFYAYQDNDNNPGNGVTDIFSVYYNGEVDTPPLPSGGNIPSQWDPSIDYPDAIVVDGFPAVSPNRSEFKFSPASLRDGVSKTALENPTNYLHGQSNADLSTVAFTNLNLSGSNPVLTVTASPSSVTENGPTNSTFTFSLSAAAAISANFSVSGNATYNTDYTVTSSSPFTFNGSSGTITIASGTTASLTINPTSDSTLEPDETVTLTLNAGTGYDAGSPSIASATIVNDDTKNITPLVAVTGLNQSSTNPPVEGFSFVVLDDFTGGEIVYFTERPFNNSTLQFSGNEAVVKWVAPAITRGNVIFVKETSSNTYTVTCSGGGACGTITHEGGSFDLASQGEGFSAYSDTDNNPNNGITDYYAVLFTGTSATPGGNIPAIENPSDYVGSVIVDGFAATAAKRTEYKFVAPARSNTVDQANFQNTGNWLHSETIQDLSIVPFANITIAAGSANPIATITASPTAVSEDSGTGMVYTFALSAASVGITTINFSVSGTATYVTDYTVSGAASFNASAGTVTIANGATTATVTITAVVDTDVEVQETVVLALASGTG
tara:strand:+ start:7762 stop:9795 length:2034 start_codon:yes stop_codon:yes gene_type:complete